MPGCRKWVVPCPLPRAYIRTTCSSELASNKSFPAHPSPHHPTTPISGVRPGSVSSVAQLDVPDQFFSEKSAPGSDSVRDKIGRGNRSEGTPEKRFGFFGFLQQKRWDSGTHNPLVPGSSPGGRAISPWNHSVMTLGPGDRSPLVWGIVGWLAREAPSGGHRECFLAIRR